MTGYIVIVSGTIPEVTEVRVYDQALDHVKQRHPEVPIELPSLSYALEKAISDPSHVETSRTGHYTYVHAGMTNYSGDPLRVVVKVIQETSARMQTAYFASRTGTSFNIVWTRDKS